MKAKRPKNWIRLTCEHCHRDDWDGITPKRLKELVKQRAIRDVYETQSWEDATDLTRNLDLWETHECECRECVMELCGDEFVEADMGAIGEVQQNLFV